MTLALDRPPTVSLLGQPAGEMVLRVRGTARAGEEIRLRGLRCSVGSAPGSTLRLIAEGVQPLHCLLLRGARRTMIHCLAADTWLNGISFQTAPITQGDVLKIGALELKVAELSDPSSQDKLDELFERCERLQAECGE